MLVQRSLTLKSDNHCASEMKCKDYKTAERGQNYNVVSGDDSASPKITGHLGEKNEKACIHNSDTLTVFLTVWVTKKSNL